MNSTERSNRHVQTLLKLEVERNEFRLRVLQWDALSCPERVLGSLLAALQGHR